jgi:hypothetical protein
MLAQDIEGALVEMDALGAALRKPPGKAAWPWVTD